MVIYLSGPIYQDSQSSDVKKVQYYDTIISQLETTAMLACLNADTVEYSIDTGQSKQYKIFRTAGDVQKAIRMFEQLRQMYINRVNGSIVRRMDSSNFTYPQYGGGFGYL